MRRATAAIIGVGIALAVTVVVFDLNGLIRVAPQTGPRSSGACLSIGNSSAQFGGGRWWYNFSIVNVRCSMYWSEVTVAIQSGPYYPLDTNTSILLQPGGLSLPVAFSMRPGFNQTFQDWTLSSPTVVANDQLLIWESDQSQLGGSVSLIWFAPEAGTYSYCCLPR